MVVLMSSEDDKFFFAYDWKRALQHAAETTGESTEEEVNWEEIEESNGYTKTGYKNIAGYHPTDPGQKMTSP